jgi:uncharacterized protein (DUF2062 family)
VALARGTAVGVCIGIAPLMPFKSVLILFFTVATKSSTVAAFITCTIICNPFTYVPLYYLAWLVGNFLLPGRAGWATLQDTLARMQEVGLLRRWSWRAVGAQCHCCPSRRWPGTGHAGRLFQLSGCAALFQKKGANAVCKAFFNLVTTMKG